MNFLFYLFAATALAGGIGVVINRNPVSSAFAMIVSFLGLAALFIQLDAYLVGILQILVYAGAIMVLFLFIIMLLDVPSEERRRLTFGALAAAAAVAGGFLLLLGSVLRKHGAGRAILEPLDLPADAPSDVHRIGDLLFSTYWFPIQIVGVLLLVATVGVVVLSKRELR
ncbi:MAG: NADH-quinone oxidoreductase subunit J [Verrucomicrobiae bacterium]|nr:NADH-quinone oxidoreductase subunit J [Verrucomicrobiae bacterium]MCP5539091.1 NADH-quinone oxidoreductase subunit J [Akkermansiaceae bacterium]MCP5551963.1 NADH-quinone oxidoreductase subunit J [Akkermansiaceae bacterium]